MSTIGDSPTAGSSVPPAGLPGQLPPQRRQRQRNVNADGSTITGRILLYIVLGLFGIVFLFPFFYVFVIATHPIPFANPPHIWFGTALIENFDALFSQIPFMRSFFNSLGIATLATVSVIFFCTLGGFAFAKYEFKGKDFLLLFVITTLAIPPFLNIIPFFRMMIAFDWYQTWLPLIVPGMANSYGIFLMKQFLEDAIPSELMDAARMDGLNELQMLPNLVFPLAKPAIAILATITFIGSWNNFLGALVMLPDPRNSTLPVSLSSLFVRSDGNFGGLMLGTALSLLPLLLVFVFFSRRIISNLTAGAVKG